MMTEIVSLFDYTLHRRYWGVACRSLLGMARFKNGLGRQLDSLALWGQSLLGLSRPITNIHVETIWRKLSGLYNGRIKAALFYDTSWYKETSFIGMIEAEGKQSFVKVYQQPEDVIFQSHQARFIQEHFSGPFVTVPVLVAQDLFLVSPYIASQRQVNKQDHVDQHILHLSNRLKRETQVFKIPRDIVPLDFAVLCGKAEDVELYARVTSWLQNHYRVLPVIPIHGDMTPWNMFINTQEKIVLIDYERAGWHVPYYDYFHYILQPLALKKRVPKIRDIVLDIEYAEKEQCLILYLIDQLHFDLGSRFDKNYRHKHIDRLIRHKRQWLLDLLNA